MAHSEGSRAEHFVIAQLSDIHFGDVRFDKALLDRALLEVRELQPDLVVISGDLTASGYRDEFDEARAYLDAFDTGCPMVVIPGNHDSRNVGWVHFERLFGARRHAEAYPFVLRGQDGTDQVKVVAVDSTRPDVNDGEVGPELYDWIAQEFAGDYAFRVFVMHHHLVSIPGTGRERNVALDGGDVLASLSSAGVDLALSGHKHVPWVWGVGNAFVVASGTAGTRRLRGDTPPSYNVIRVTPSEVQITFRNLDGKAHLVQHFERSPRYRHAHEMVNDVPQAKASHPGRG